jgi:hypothetical protein
MTRRDPRPPMFTAEWWTVVREAYVSDKTRVGQPAGRGWSSVTNWYDGGS